MSFNFKQYGFIDVENFKNNLNKLDWDEYTFRQTTHRVHANTKTIPLIWDEMGLKTIYRKDYKIFSDNISVIKERLTKYLGPGEIKSALLINLFKNSTIARHTDSGEYFSKNNRIHIPIITNKKCIFEVDGEEINMREGEIWEINNNDKSHSVKNEGNSDRIHLLIDWYPYGYDKQIKQIKSII